MDQINSINHQDNKNFPTIRDMTLSDADDVFSIGSKEQYFSASENKENFKSSGFWPKSTIEKWALSSCDIALVAENKKGIQGFVLLTVHRTNRKAELENLWVHPNWRGTQVTKNLIDTVINKIHENGTADFIVALTEEENLSIQKSLQKYSSFEKGKTYVWMSLRINS